MGKLKENDYCSMGANSVNWETWEKDGANSISFGSIDFYQAQAILKNYTSNRIEATLTN